MVNTRRSETVGSTPEISSNQHRTRRRVVQDISRSRSTTSPSSASSSSSSSDTESEDHVNDSSFDERGKAKLKKPGQLNSKVHELRNRFVCNERKYSSRLQSENIVKNRKRLALNDKRSLAVYSRNMHQDFDMMFDSDDELYPRSRRSCHLRARLARRTALSLRPIVQKSYADPLSPLFNSECDSGVRRSKRQRKVQFDSMSWITDDQMHKDGYPNLNTSGYSDDDSRDAPETLTETSRRTTRQVKNPKYLFDYETKINSSTQRRNSETNLLERNNKKNLKTRRESNDKENKQQTNINGRSHMRNKKDDDDDEDKDEGGEDGDDDDDDEEINVDGDSNDNQQEQQQQQETGEDNSNDTEKVTQENGINDEKPKQLRTNVEKKESTDSDEMPKLRTQTKRNNLLINRNFPSRRTRNRRDMDDTDDSEDSNRKYRYSLRTRQPKDVPKSSYELSMRSRHHHNRRRKVPSSTSDTSTDDDVTYSKNQKDKKNLKNEQKMKSGAGGSKIIPIGPETLDTKIRFSCIGGLDNHIQCLKEMVLLPMMYPEVFQQFQIQPPKGVLFHGPPGTGKTLLARALANECSVACRKVSFFMRKGADLLSKWIGESERQLRLLFEQAAEMQPSIIFFDELDGLAPVRSSRQDQIHASIVSTLLALMDGLDNRGDVIVIGATNRIDAIDPALRRPGRFDRELYFPLPAKREREEILKVHVSQWKKRPNDELLSYLAENAVGYCGSDLRALCSEAVIHGFRRAYPQVYNSDHRLLLNPENVTVEKIDFLKAKSLLVPSSHRITQGLGKKLIPILEPLLNDPLHHILATLKTTFPHAINPALSKVKLSSNLKPAQLLLIGESSDCGQTTHLAPAVLYKMEHIHTYILDLATLFNESGRGPEETCIQVFNEARRNIPSVIYIPNIDNLWSLINDVVKSIFETQVANLGVHIPILLLSTANTKYDNLPNEIQAMFSRYRKEVYELDLPNDNYREAFFRPLIIDSSLKPPRPSRERPITPPPLPKAVTPPPTLLTEEQKRKLYEQEEHTLRELRIFLRDMCKKLANNKLFYMFTKPVDTDTVPDYTEIIKQPMDLETMMTKVDFHRYECAKDFLEDIELICRNALEYNPAKTSADKQIRHRACSLRDYAYTLIKSEMDSDFEDKCQEIAKKRQQRKASIQKYLPPYIQTPENVGLLKKNEDDEKEQRQEPHKQQQQQDEHQDDKIIEKEHKSDKQSDINNSIISRPTKKRKYSRWQNGVIIIKKKRRKDSNVRNADNENDNNEHEKVSSDERSNLAATPVGEFLNSSEDVSNATVETSKPLTIDCDISVEKSEPNSSQSPRRRLSDLMSPSELLAQPLEIDEIDRALNETAQCTSAEVKRVDCNVEALQQILEQTVKLTCGCTLQTLLDLYNQLSDIIRKYSNTHHRSNLPKELSNELTRFRNETGSETFSEGSPSTSVLVEL